MTERYTFSQDNVDKAPNEHGVYKLYQGDELIYIGRAVGIGVTMRTRLQCHFRGDEGPCTRQATTYERLACADPSAVEAQLLSEFRRLTGRLPRCNARVG